MSIESAKIVAMKMVAPDELHFHKHYEGISKIIIQKLEEKIIELGGCEMSADPSEENIFSIKALLSNGFEKKRDEDYRKRITTKIKKQ